MTGLGHIRISGLAKQQRKSVGISGHGFSAHFITQFVIRPVVEVREIDEFEPGGEYFVDDLYRIGPPSVFVCHDLHVAFRMIDNTEEPTGPQ